MLQYEQVKNVLFFSSSERLLLRKILMKGRMKIDTSCSRSLKKNLLQKNLFNFPQLIVKNSLNNFFFRTQGVKKNLISADDVIGYRTFEKFFGNRKLN